MSVQNLPRFRRPYGIFLRIRFLNGLQYRAAALGGLVTQFFWGGLTICLYAAFYRSDAAAFPMTFPQLVNYIWLQQAFLALFFVWQNDNEIFDCISSGQVAYELCRPWDLYGMWFARNAAHRLSSAALRCVPVLLVAALLPAPYGLTAPASWQAFLCGLLSGVLGFLVVVAFVMLLYIATFYTLSPLGLRIAVSALSEFLSGGLIPLPFLPDGVRQVVNLLPFASMQNAPFLIYSGSVTGPAILSTMALQCFWLGILFLVGRLFMRRTLRRVVVQGG